MTTVINKKTLEQYCQIFGRERMKSLWSDFQTTTEEKLSNINEADKEQIRLCFHSLRSSSLVFGMEKFALCCEKIENLLVEESELYDLQKSIDKSKELYYNARGVVINFFEEI